MKEQLRFCLNNSLLIVGRGYDVKYVHFREKDFDEKFRVSFRVSVTFNS